MAVCGSSFITFSSCKARTGYHPRTSPPVFIGPAFHFSLPLHLLRPGRLSNAPGWPLFIKISKYQDYNCLTTSITALCLSSLVSTCLGPLFFADEQVVALPSVALLRSTLSRLQDPVCPVPRAWPISAATREVVSFPRRWFLARWRRQEEFCSLSLVFWGKHSIIYFFSCHDHTLLLICHGDPLNILLLLHPAFETKNAALVNG